MNVRYGPRARADLHDIAQYLSERSLQGAVNVLRDIGEYVNLLREHPRAGLETGQADVRVKISRRYRYRVFYREAKEAVLILHIRHPARRPVSYLKP
ncbi:MAG: type II toxin-antitoxin system RelE/ParE family toxin [Bauldia sp.]|nr:type II toxin-antitoxin system RelE/ParE family toxin [Bauldia sp.]